MTFKQNLTILNYIKDKAKANKDKIQDIIDLYKDRKIVNIKTAINAAELLASTHKQQQDKAINKYSELVKKHKNKDVMVEFIFYRKVEKGHKSKLYKIKRMPREKFDLVQVAIIQTNVNTHLDTVNQLYRKLLINSKKEHEKDFDTLYNIALTDPKVKEGELFGYKPDAIFKGI